MKKLFITLLCMAASICASHAQQKIVGDMNDDGVLNIADITTLVNTVLGKTAQKTVSGGGSDQTTLVGKWCKKDGSYIWIKSDGKATMKTVTVSTYDYFPSKNSLFFYNSSNDLVAAYKVKSFSSSCLTLCALGSSTNLYYYPYSTYARSVSMSETSASMSVGKTKQLSLVPSPAGSRLYDAIWSSDNTSVATVSSSGLVTAKGVGSANIIAQIDGVGSKVFCTITVLTAVESLTLSQTEATVVKGSSFTLTPTITPSDATYKALTWTSSNSSIASVSNGKVTAGNTVGTATITAKTTDGTNLSATCKVTVSDVTPTSLELNYLVMTMEAYSSKQILTRIKPSGSGLTAVWTSSNETIVTVDQTGKVTSKGKAGKCVIKATIPGTNLSADCTVKVDHAYVDLGLPSGALWAVENVGAYSPEEYGGYYAWGETGAYGEVDASNAHNYSYNSKKSYTKTYYDWCSYKWCSGTTAKTLTKYNNSNTYGTVDNKTTLELTDDAAYKNWGTNWRMPTYTEMKELYDNCTWTETTMNGVYGFKVVSKKDTSKYIFLPAAGDRSESSLGGSGYSGSYWTSSLCLLSERGSAFAMYYGFVSNRVFTDSWNFRYYGCSVRPVRRQ